MVKSRSEAGAQIAGVAVAVGEPTRANMLAVMMDGLSHTATELASASDVTAATASGHLSRLLDSGLVKVSTQGRHRNYSLASQEIAAMLESLMVIAATRRAPRRRIRIPEHLREARTCYDHLAGRLGVAISGSLLEQKAISFADGTGEVTPAGVTLLSNMGVAITRSAERSRRALCRPCLDWSEQQPHIAGVLGKALLQRLLEIRWIEKVPQSRAIAITRVGQREMGRVFAWLPTAGQRGRI